ncbi:MAG: glycyl-tRNA synthetase beta chain [Betaproteobacteria bacterium]|jgi:glycyl-tRNA synthetase beta chain|nr:glycyl-tRNA synthetase beta chain [Betaproteobacteria bacterium]
MEASLLIELLTEELPPKSLVRLQDAFANELVAEIVRHRLKDRDPKKKAFATPRRLAVLIPGVLDKGADSENPVEGPQSSNAKAVEGFAKKHKLDPKDLERRQTPKGEIVVAHVKLPGVSLDAVLAEIVEKAIKKLPIAKVMRWGSGEAQFVRPVHGLVMLHGKKVVPGSVLGLQSGNRTRGHRFMGTGEIALASADEYEQKLAEGSVVADFERRKGEIDSQLQAAAAREKGSLGEYRDLLDEVTALVEQPSVYVGTFDAAFLAVPQECLILTMRQNQKYFPLFDASGKLLPKFLIVSNMKVADPRHIIGGNQRVVRPRLEDARFFYDQDRKTRLEARVPALAKVVYHNKLGSQLERVQRVKLLAGKIAGVLGADVLLAERAAELAKADLLTGMVGEFPELQGVMGRYYALHDGEPPQVADAIEQHYRPRFAGDRLPEGPVACAVALADKLDAIAGLFSIGQHPTGEKDPFGLRRAALGAVRILVENKLRLSLKELIHAAFEPFPTKPHTALRDFMFDRFAGYLKEQGYSTLQVDAVLSKQPVNLSVVPQQLEAVKAFQSLPEAESLAAANKRVANILKQAEAKGEKLDGVEVGILQEPAERALLDAIRSVSDRAKALYEKGDYTGYLKSFAVLKAPVDAFFDKVMVMVEDEKLRRGRLALLRDLREAMNRVADLSKLAA